MHRCLSFCLHLLAISASVFLSGCVFESDDEYFKELAKPDPNQVNATLKTVDLADYNPGDTIDIFGTTSFNFSGNYGAIEKATVFLGGNLITSGSTDSFTIDFSDLSNGIFVLKLDLITKTGSGSLADAVGAEKFIMTMKWIVRVDLSLPPQPVPTLSIVNGFLTMEWAPYSKPNFRAYRVERKIWNGVTKTVEITNKQTVRWTDDSYTGGYPSPVQYSVSIVSETGTTKSLPISRTDPIDINFSFNILDSTFTFKWKPTKFYGAFKSYKFTHGGTGQDIIDLTGVNDSTFSYKLSTIRFGSSISVGLSVQSKIEGIPSSWNWNKCTLGTPLTFTPAGEILFNGYLNAYVVVDANKRLLELNDNLEPVREIATLRSTNWKMPYPGRYVYTFLNYHDGDNIYRLDLEDNSEVSYDYTYLEYQNSNSVASNGLLCFDYDRPPIPGTNIPAQYVTRVFDPAGGSNVFAETSNTVKLSAVISGDGKFIWANGNRVLKISGDNAELVGVLSPVGTFLGFRPDNCTEIMFIDGAKVNFYDANTLTLIRTINPPANNYTWNRTHDVKTKNMLWTSLSVSGRLYTVNIETGVARQIRISTNATPADFLLVNGLLIYKESYINVE
jgi:hypothetical protein